MTSFVPFTQTQVQDLVPSTTKKLCLFACHPSPDPNVQQYVLQLAKQFDLVLCLHSKNDQVVWQCPTQNVKSVIVPNYLLDMGMWMRVLINLDMTGLDQIALVNDSCTAIKPIDVLFQSNFTGFWGVCDSYEISHHIQSFFLVFEKAVVPLLDTFVKQLAPKIDNHDGDKRAIINSFEIGISTFIKEHSFELDTVYNSTLVNAHPTPISPNVIRINPTYYYWDRMLSLGCPLLKKTRAHYENEIEFIKQYRKIQNIKII